MISKIKNLLGDDKVIKHIKSYGAVVSGEIIFANCIKKRYNVNIVDIFIPSKNLDEFLMIINENNWPSSPIKYSYSFDGFNNKFVKFVVEISEYFEYSSSSSRSKSRSFSSNSSISKDSSFDSKSSSIGGKKSARFYNIFVVHDNIPLQKAVENTYNVSVFRMMYDGDKIVNVVDCDKIEIDVTEDVYNILTYNDSQKIHSTRQIIDYLQNIGIEIRIKLNSIQIEKQNSKAVKTNEWFVKLLLQLIYDDDKIVYRNQDQQHKSITFYHFLNSMKSFQYNELVMNTKLHFKNLDISKYIAQLVKHREYKKLKEDDSIKTFVKELLKNTYKFNIIDPDEIKHNVLNQYKKIKFKNTIKIHRTTKRNYFDFKKMVGYDMVEQEDINVYQYLQDSTDNLVFIYDTKCHLVTINYILHLLEYMPDNWFYICEYLQSTNIIQTKKNTPYIKLPLSVGHFLFRWEYLINLVKLYSEGIRAFLIINTNKTIQYSMSHNNLYGIELDNLGSYHCQEGSNHNIFSLKYFDNRTMENVNVRKQQSNKNKSM
jgi:hypothetical protein